jgi:hypothetical protein
MVGDVGVDWGTFIASFFIGEWLLPLGPALLPSGLRAGLDGWTPYSIDYWIGVSKWPED